MPIEQKIYRNAYFAEELPNWICPVCKSGILRSNSKNLQVIESTYSANRHHEEGWGYEDIYGGFIGKLLCENAQCKEAVVFSGRVDADINSRLNENGEWVNEVDRRIIPQYFNPPLELFPVKKTLPNDLQKIIVCAFGLFWHDASSCANKIRTAVEFVLDEKKIKKYPPRKRRNPIPLFQRIEIFERKNPDAAKLFNAIRFIGNAGSHSIDKVKKGDLLTAFEILERSLDIVYDHHPKKIAKLAKEIIKSRGPIRNKKAKRKPSVIFYKLTKKAR
jgi:hypothetical protein